LGTCLTESDAAALLTWTRTIDRALVHRDAIAEVLLTDVIQLGETEFVIAAQWPRSHRVYRPDIDGRHDPMLILETVRQAGLALSHIGFNVGADQQSVMHNVGFTLNPDTEPRALRSATNLTIGVHCRNVVYRGPSLRSMTVELRFVADGQKFAIGTGMISWLSRRTYTALRARAGARITDPQQPVTDLQRVAASPLRAADDSLIAYQPDGSDSRRLLVVPVQHPVYFDHPLDHAPGMMLIDAAWQAVAAMRGDGARLVQCLMQCPSFTELGLTTSIELAATSSDTTQFSVEQAGRQTASGTLRVWR
jgi:2-oxo-3-(phosphooxy)propyl 3-oxoalkanoate synthase